MAGSQTLSSLILSDLNDRSTRFVYPSAVAAAFWMEFAAETAGKAVAKNRFIAWDDFKAETLAEARRGLRPANGAFRSIFAATLLAENASAASRGAPLFTELISREHASGYGAFIASLARSLPALDGVVSRTEELATADPYFADLALVRSRYADFLIRYGLFEPAWNRVPFRPSSFRWILVCPELAEDWNEYDDELSDLPSVRIVRLGDLEGPTLGDGADAARRTVSARRILGDASGRLLRFGTAREEIRWIALAVARLLQEEDLLPSDIAISIPNVQEYADRLLLEFRLRDVPAELRAGRAISDQPVGRLFSAISACPATRWSFRALKDLLLDAALPWRDRDAIDALMEFGLRYRCVSGFPDNGADVDVWERSFERIREGSEEIRVPLGKIEAFYRKLKRDIAYVVTAPSFAELREHILKFKSNHFDEVSMDIDVDRTFRRSLEELADLAETERRLEGLRVERPFDLFRTHLRGIPYVFQSDAPGVRVYDYRVSALIAPAVHIVANATQDAATVRSNPAPFLREDRKLRARLDERDMSGDFISAYARSGGAVVFTAGAHGFTTHSVPHRALSGEEFKETPESKKAGSGPDPIRTEVGLALARAAGTDIASRGPSELNGCGPTSTQKKSWEAMRALARGTPALDVRREPIADPAAAAGVRARLTRSEGGERLSPTDLNEFNACAYSWFLRRGLGIKEKQTDIETVDQRELGTLYHRILQRLFDRIKTEDVRFRIDRVPRYKDLLIEEVGAALTEARMNEGAFQESVYAMLKPRLISALSAYLDADAARLDSCAILGAEMPLKRDYPDLGPSLSGIADLVLKRNDGNLVIIDFKTGRMPLPADLVPENDMLGDLQIASYVRMAESDGTDVVREARFYSIDNRGFRHVLSDEDRARASALLPLSRDEYSAALEAVDESMEAAAGALAGAEYPVPPIGSRAACATCRVISVCRIPFAGGDS